MNQPDRNAVNGNTDYIPSSVLDTIKVNGEDGFCIVDYTVNYVATATVISPDGQEIVVSFPVGTLDFSESSISEIQYEVRKQIDPQWIPAFSSIAFGGVALTLPEGFTP